MNKMHQTSPVMKTTILIKLASFSAERMSNDLYPLMEAVMLMIKDYGEDKLEKEIKDWKIKKKRLTTLNQLIARSKTFYDSIQNKRFEKMKLEDVQEYFKKKYIHNASKIAVLQEDLYEIAVYLINNSDIQNQTMRTEYLKVLEYQTPMRINTDKAQALSRGNP